MFSNHTNLIIVGFANLMKGAGMDRDDIGNIYDTSAERIRETDCSFHRFLCGEIDWSVRVLALSGPRGVGKTTMFLQHLKENPGEAEKALYVSMDSIWLDARDVYDLVRHHVQHGGESVYLDEIHYLADWQKLVKNLYDNFKGLRVAYTGSSILRIAAGSGDLSRRQVEYSLPGMSFREYLALEGVADFQPIPLERILADHVAMAYEVTSKIRVLPHFEQYLKDGYYPFYREERSHFASKLRQVVNQVLDVDLPKVEDITPETVQKARRMLTILSASTPQTPNVADLCRDLGMDRKQGIKVLYAMRRAGLVGLLAEDADALKRLGAPNKIFCDNTNLMDILAPRPDVGTVREVFFNNQVGVRHETTFPRRGDSLVDGRYLFEIGGPRKSFEQIKDVSDSYVAADGIEVGRGNKIPLWLFGFLY